MQSAYKIAGIDVHKKMLAVVIASESNGELSWERRQFGAAPSDLGKLRQWLLAVGVSEVVMESTAQYWKPVWAELEPHFKLHLAQAQSNRAPRGRKSDFADAERLVRRHIAGELILSFVPDPEQRLWRTMTHAQVQLTRDKVRLVNQLEALLEDAHIKLSSLVSDVVGVMHGACCRLWRKGKQTQPSSRPWRTGPYAPPRSNSAMHSRPALPCSPSTGTC